jgi:gamma-glutamyltranspeptidase
VILNVIDFGMTPAEAVSAPRFCTKHHLGSFNQTAPVLGSLLLYSEFSKATVNDLASRGHKISLSQKHFAEPSLIVLDQKTGMIHTAGDPRAKRYATAY